MISFHPQIFHKDISKVISLTLKFWNNLIEANYIRFLRYLAEIFLIFHLELIIHLKKATNFWNFLNYNQEELAHLQVKHWPKYYLDQ